jgi:hypothetical protein
VDQVKNPVKLYITATEARGLAAMEHYQSRELTDVEKVIKHIWTVSRMANSTVAERGEKKKEVDFTVKTLLDFCGDDRLASRIELAAYSPEIMKDLLAVYPMVEFEDLICQRVTLAPLAFAHAAGYSFAQVKGFAEWLLSFYAVLEKLPKGVETYIGTPQTDYIGLKGVWLRTQDKKFLGYVLNPVTQTQINGLFGLQRIPGGMISPIDTIQRLELYKEPDLYRRVQVEAPVTKFKLTFPLTMDYSGKLLKAVNEETNSTYYFCL